MRVQCSNCGKRSKAEAFVLLDRGWRAIGDADYCPKCAKNNRNRTNYVMTMTYWLRRFDAELERRRNEIHQG